MLQSLISLMQWLNMFVIILLLISNVRLNIFVLGIIYVLFGGQLPIGWFHMNEIAIFGL